MASPRDTRDRYTMLIVDDDERYRTRLVRAFERRDYGVFAVGDGGAALETARRTRVDYAVVDLRMPGSSGLEVVRGLKLVSPSTEVVVVTGYGSIATAIAAMKSGAVQYVSKPADVDDILKAFHQRSPAAALAAEVPSLARVEWEHINRVLAACDGNISKAARLLGLPRRSLQRKLAKHPVPR